MTARVAINGFGRVGRLCLRSMLERHKDRLSVVALNDLADLKTNAHLFQYDSSYGPFTRKLEIGEGLLKMDGWEIRVFNHKDPSKLPWKALGIDIVIESTGVFTDGAHVRSHLDAGAKNVIVTAPAKNIDFTVVLGVNESEYDPKKHRMVSNASCTTNCLAPVVKVRASTQWRKAGRHCQPGGYHKGDRNGEAHCDAYADLRLVSPPGIGTRPCFSDRYCR